MIGRHGELRVGTSGYLYEHWRGRFYPDALPQHAWLGHYATAFAAVEINNTFYGLPAPETFDGWREAVPAGFRFALKFSRYGSHLKRLLAPEQTLPAFVERAERLGRRLGPILVQLPPRWRPEPERLDAFLEAAPAHLRWVVELRDQRWLCDEVYATLRQHNAALCIHDLNPRHPRLLTADFVYLRFHGTGPRYSGAYPVQQLTARAREIEHWLAAGRDVWAFFNNDAAAHAPRDAARLARLIGRRGQARR